MKRIALLLIAALAFTSCYRGVPDCKPGTVDWPRCDDITQPEGPRFGASLICPRGTGRMLSGLRPGLRSGVCSYQSSFAPNQISQGGSTGSALLKLWLRADRGITKAGGVVSQWDDQSGNGNHVTQGTVGLRPAFVASALGGLPGVLSAVTKSLNSTTEPIAASAARTIFIVLKPGSTTSTYPYSCRSTTGYSLTFGTSLATIETNNTSTNSFIPSAPTGGVSYIFETSFDGVQTNLMTARLNGASQLVTNGVGVGVGAESGADLLSVVNGFDAPVSEILVYNVVLNSGNATMVRRDLGGRYGIAVP